MVTLNIRGLDSEVKVFIESAKGARGLTYAGYLERLVRLHQFMLIQEEEAWPAEQLLIQVGLEVVQV